MTPKEYKEMMAYLTRSGIRKQVKFASDVARPDPKPVVQEIEAINAFMKRNPQADGGRIGFDNGGKVKKYRVRSDDPDYVPKKGGPSPITIKGKNNPNYKPLNKKEKEIARKQFKDEIKKYGSVVSWIVMKGKRN